MFSADLLSRHATDVFLFVFFSFKRTPQNASKDEVLRLYGSVAQVSPAVRFFFRLVMCEKKSKQTKANASPIFCSPLLFFCEFSVPEPVPVPPPPPPRRLLNRLDFVHLIVHSQVHSAVLEPGGFMVSS